MNEGCAEGEAPPRLRSRSSPARIALLLTDLPPSDRSD